MWWKAELDTREPKATGIEKPLKSLFDMSPFYWTNLGKGVFKLYKKEHTLDIA